MKLGSRTRRLESAVGAGPSVSLDEAFEKYSRYVQTLTPAAPNAISPSEVEPLTTAERAVLEASGIRGVSSWLAYVLEHGAGTGACP